MSKEMNKKTGVSKLEKENIGNVTGGYTIETYDNGNVVVRGIVKPSQTEPSQTKRQTTPENQGTFVEKTFKDMTQAVSWAEENLLPTPFVPFVKVLNPPVSSK